MNNNDLTRENILEPELQAVKSAESHGLFTIGLVGNYPDTDETRFLLTPEACGLLTSAGIRIVMQKGAAIDINFNDENYCQYGVEIGSRIEALKSDIVLSYAPLKAHDIRHMRPHSVLLTVMSSDLFATETIDTLLERGITCGCFDNMYSHNDEAVFADIIDEVDGRAAVMYAQDYLSFTGGGKGVLLGGVTGLNPCEVLIFGEGRDVCYAARAARAAGASVTLMNNDISALMIAREFCGEGVDTIAIHPRVLANRIKTADVIFLGTCTRPFELSNSLKAAMKDTVYVLDFQESQPSVCVPRTIAMALSNPVVNFFDEMVLKNGFNSMLATTPGVQSGIVTFGGKLTDKLVATYLGMKSVDISVMLAHTPN